ncbi:MBOAT family protein [Flavobacterium sp. MFBS3-15]|uniref:MBOAT family O-acyltransferase n=1 Tax=Flavobacterium sp. MFBS3-15 TaxID=2989816 RepID=UPI002235A167|nr:MBOAT family O-acyltransferase [Flavobacterium sp. MFBS3-15]MCW4470558.1 MBOAT family protein [Flavobacterium sp. MFBS3-15]
MQLNDFLPQLTWQDVGNWFIYDPESPLLFNTGRFLALFLMFYAGYIMLRDTFRMRLVYTIVFSLFFYYNSSGVYFLLLLMSSVVDYTLSYFLYREQRTVQRRVYLWFSVIVNLTFLGYFKYTTFILESTNTLFGWNYTFHKVLLPVGISFYTFQSISYIIEIYRKEITPAKNYVDYLFFVSFFPQLVAGPIVRAKDFLPQIYSKLQLTRSDVNYALFLIIGGLIKKTVISDYISINFVDRVFDSPNSYTAFENLMAAYGYTIQIYCDFSGYSDMAIGVALLLGFKLPTNFRTPYKSASITEFWRRWHISLSTWLKDFLYISVGGNRNSTVAGFLFPALFFFGLIVWGITYAPTSNIPLFIAIGGVVVFCLTFLLAKKDKERTMFTNVNLLTTMLLGGLWHGASLRFIIWGALHGIALAVHKLFSGYFPESKEGKTTALGSLWTFVSVLLTFHFVAFCWIFFRAKDFSVALDLINNIGNVTFDPAQWEIIIMGYKNVFLLMLIGYVWHFLPEGITQAMKKGFDKSPLVVKGILMGLVYWLVYAAASAGPQPFIYFQF